MLSGQQNDFKLSLSEMCWTQPLALLAASYPEDVGGEKNGQVEC